MSRCRICRKSVQRYHVFCSNCGARCNHLKDISLIDRFSGFLRSQFPGEAEAYFCEGCEKGMEISAYAIDDHEKAAKCNKHYRYALSETYLQAAEQSTGRFGGIGLKWNSFTSIKEDRLAQAILSGARECMKSENIKSDFALSELDEALNGALLLYSKSIKACNDNSHPYGVRASVLHEVADIILYRSGMAPPDCSDPYYKEDDGKPFQCGNLYGISLRGEIPDIEFASELEWILRKSEDDFHEALKRDPTNTWYYIELSDVQKRLGKIDEASQNLDKTILILNKAIKVNNKDIESYSERSSLLEKLGKMDLAIADLESALHCLSEYDWQHTDIKRKLQKLLKERAASVEAK